MNGPFLALLRTLREAIAEPYGVNSIRPAMNPRQKPCVRTGCDGTMVFDDTEMPPCATWVCERNPDHRESIGPAYRPPHTELSREPTMRRPFWRRHPKWRAIDLEPWEMPGHCDQEVVACELRRRVGMARLSVSLVVGVADVIFAARREDTPFFDCERAGHRSWVLSDVPTDRAALQTEVASVLTQCGCRRARHLEDLISEELIRLVTNARAQRESRLKMLPAPAPVRWDEMRHTPWIRHGVYSDDARSIEVAISYEALEPGKGLDGDDPQPVAFLVSTTPEPGRKAQVALSLDGLCAEGVVRTLETWGWARQTALAVGRAVAIQARTDWLALLSGVRRIQESRPRLTRDDIERAIQAHRERTERLTRS